MGDIPATPNIVWKTSTQSPGLSPIPPPSRSCVSARLPCSCFNGQIEVGVAVGRQERKEQRERIKRGDDIPENPR